MDQTLVTALGDLIGKVGFPGTILIALAWLGKQLLPVLIKLFENLNESLASIATDIKEIKSDIKDLPKRLAQSS